jgi:hypothetical protein
VRANAGGKKGGLGGIPPNGSFLVFKTSKINYFGISRRTTSVQKKVITYQYINYLLILRKVN